MNRKNILTEAWLMFRTFAFDFADCMRKAWMLAKLRKALKQQRVVQFYYQKMNGEIRQAFGTLKEDCIPQTNGEGKQYAFCQKYYDIEKGEWRMFKTYNIVKVVL